MIICKNIRNTEKLVIKEQILMEIIHLRRGLRLEKARKATLIGNIILIIQVGYMILATILNFSMKVIGATFSAGNGTTDVSVLVLCSVILFFSWQSMNKLSEQSWRTFLLVAAILLLLMAYGNLIVSICFILAYIWAKKAV